MGVNAKEYGYFFNSNSGDRTYNADSFETWLKPYFVSGVIAGGLQVLAQSTPDMTVTVTSGYANLDGKPAHWPDANTLTLSTASGVYSRIDTIVLRRDNTNRAITLEVVTGTPSGSPQPTAPTRTADVYELVLAQILVGTGVTAITQSNITDKRPDTSVCGYVMCTIETPDFSELYAQFEAQAAEFISEETAGFLEWFEAIRGQLDEDAAGHLQNEVDVLNSYTGCDYDAYDATEAYSQGDRVIYNGKVYECISTQPVVGGISNPSYFVIVDSLTDKVANNSQAIAKTIIRGTKHTLAVGGTISSQSISCPGLTANHVVGNWGLMNSAENAPLDPNAPPGDITIIEGANAYTLTVTNVTTAFVFTPVFILPQNLT